MTTKQEILAAIKDQVFAWIDQKLAGQPGKSLAIIQQGVDAFLQLTDAPHTFVGQAGKSVRVKATEDGLEFAAGGTGDMLKSVYDADGDNVVDNSEALNGHADTYFAQASHTHTRHMMAIATFAGTLTTQTGKLVLQNRLGVDATITEVHCVVSTLPAGSSIIVDVNVYGNSIFTNQAHRPQILAGQAGGYTTQIDSPTWGAGGGMSVDIDQVGSGTAGADLLVTITYTITE